MRDIKRDVKKKILPRPGVERIFGLEIQPTCRSSRGRGWFWCESRDSPPRPGERLELCLSRLPLSQSFKTRLALSPPAEEPPRNRKSESPGRSPGHGREAQAKHLDSPLLRIGLPACLLAERSGRDGTASSLGSGEVGSGRRAAGNAPVGDISISPFTGMRRPGNALASWSTHQSSPRHSGKERKWKPCSRN
jgi:hypothetical protein